MFKAMFLLQIVRMYNLHYERTVLKRPLIEPNTSVQKKPDNRVVAGVYTRATKSTWDRLTRELETRPMVKRDGQKIQEGESDTEQENKIAYGEHGKQDKAAVSNKKLEEELRAELEKIVRGDALPITEEMRSVQEGDTKGFFIRKSCSNRRNGESEMSIFLRWNQRVNR